MNIGDIVKGEIVDFTHEGNGVLKVDNFTIFASGGLIGDKVEVKIKEIKKTYAIGSVINITEPSKDRVKLDFNLSESKGAIPLIEYDYEKQLEWKRKKVETDILKFTGIEDVKVNETLGMEYPYRYRNHVQIPVGEKNGKVEIGFYKEGSNEIVDMKETILLPEMGNRILNIIRPWIEKYNIRAYNKKTKKGILRHIGIRINKNEETMVILVTGDSKLPNIDQLIEELKKNNVVSIYQNINKLQSSVTYGKEYKKLYGEDKLVDFLGELKYELSPNSFFQVNRSQAEVIYNKAVEYLEPSKEDIIYDLYCGIGTISLYMAEQAKKVYGIEVVKEAIEDAKKNAIINKIDNAEFITGKVEESLPKLVGNDTSNVKLVLDPPRKGCEKEVLESIIKMNPERIVYISCNPTTMARDIKEFVGSGYRVVEVQPVDMFGHTGHVECVVGIQKI